MSLTLPRTCHAGLAGPDVRAYSRVYRHAGIRKRDETPFFGVHMVDNTIAFQHHHGLQADGVVGPHTFDAMRALFDGWDKILLRREISNLKPHPRDLIVGAALAMYHHRPFAYEEVRPYPSSLLGVYERGSDCSGTSEAAYHYAYLSDHNVSDPSGMHFDGYGSTYYQVLHGRRVASPNPGDLAFFYPTFSHVGIVIDHDRTFSHGKPGDPVIIPTSWATQYRSYL